MALKNLIDTIEADAARETKAIRAKAETEAAGIEAEAKARGEALYRREEDALRTRLSFGARRERSTREIEVKRALLHEREILLGEVRRKFETWLGSLPPAADKDLHAGFLAKAKALLPDGAVTLSPRTKEILGGALKGVACEPDDAMVGGLRCVSTDGR